MDRVVSGAQTSSGVIQTTRNLNVSASTTGHTVESVSSEFGNRDQQEKLNLVTVEWDQTRTTVSTST